MAERIGVRAAAKALGVSHSTVSRYLSQYPELAHREDGKRGPKVELEALRRHRAENVNPDLAPPLAEPSEQPKANAAPAESAARVVSSALTDARRENLELKNREARLAYERQAGSLVPRVEVQDAAQEAGQLLQQRFDLRRPQLAEELATMTERIASATPEVDPTLGDIVFDKKKSNPRPTRVFDRLEAQFDNAAGVG